MKHKRLFVLALLMAVISISSFFIYDNTYKEELNYVVLGDSLAAGRNPYGVDGYGYADYVRDYLKKKDKLSSYVSYATSGYFTTNVIDDINYNRTVQMDNVEINLKKALRESDLVTISIGANDLLNGMNLSSITTIFSDRDNLDYQLNATIDRIEDLLILIKQYAKGDIIVIGYYNPVPSLTKYKKIIDEAISNIDNKYEKMCNDLDVYYVKISNIISDNNNYLPNPLDIHPNIMGYEAISKEIIKIIDKKVLN